MAPSLAGVGLTAYILFSKSDILVDIFAAHFNVRSLFLNTDKLWALVLFCTVSCMSD